MKWISVKDRLPEEKKSLILWEPQYKGWSPGYYTDNKFVAEDGYGEPCVSEPSHWMEIEPPMENNRSKLIEFNDIKKDILKALEERLKELGISEQSVDLVDGFINQPFSMQLSKSIVIGGPTIPMIMLLGKKSGRIYFFALKALLKDIEV